MDAIIWALPWVVMAVILVEFVLVDELPASVLLLTAQAWQGRARRAFFEPDASRRVSGWDVAYTLLVGVGALLAMMPAMGEIVRRSGAG